MFQFVSLLLVLLLSCLACISAFTPKVGGAAARERFFELQPVIRGVELDEKPFDLGLGGVRLAQESAIKICGAVKHKPGSSDAQPSDLIRYKDIKKIDEHAVIDVLKKVDASILCKGMGKEFYKPPGETTKKEVWLGPDEAIKDALNEAGSAMQSQKLIFNFLGGDDLMMMEVLNATNHLVLQLDVPTKAHIAFNSVCHSSIPLGTCTVAVVAFRDEEVETSGFSGLEKSIANGEVYFHNGNWLTVDESDINTAEA